MRTLRLSLVGAVILALLGGLGAAVAAQEPSPEPSPAVSPVPLEAEPVSEPLPVADYWVEWLDHKQASYERASGAIAQTSGARKSVSKPARWYRRLVGVHKDELQWLANHQPLACYQDEYERWRAAVEDLHAIHTKALRFVVEDGKSAGVRRTVKQRRAAMKRLDRALLNLADCGPSAPTTAAATPSGNPFVSTWRTVSPGLNSTHHWSMKLARDGRFLVRVKRDTWCRKLEHGFVPLTVQGRGEFVTDGTPQFHQGPGKAHCYPRGGGRVFTHDDPGGATWRYHEAYDVIQTGGACMWRAKTGSPKDCKAFWRGTPPKSEPAEPPAE